MKKKYIFITSILFLFVLIYSCKKNILQEEKTGLEESISNQNSDKLNSQLNDSSTIYYDNWPKTRSTNKRSQALDSNIFSPNYVPIGTVWNQRVITYFFQSGTNDIAGTQEYQAVRDAFLFWGHATGLVFLEACNANNANIVFSWGTFAHGDPNPPCTGSVCNFDGIGGTLAHCLGGPPPNAFGSFAGDVHFDDSETWTLATRNNNQQPIDLVTVAAHEIGHSLGLDHTTVAGSLMLPIYEGSHRYLGNDDIAGIQSLYGTPSGNINISGQDEFCSSATYTITNVPSGISVIWSASPANAVTITGSGNSRTFTRAGSAVGPITITATLTNGCGSYSISKNVRISAPSAIYMSIWSASNSVNRNIPMPFAVGYPYGLCAAMETEWQVSPSSGVNITPNVFPCESSNNGTGINISFSNSGGYSVSARIRNACGWGGWSQPKYITVN